LIMRKIMIPLFIVSVTINAILLWQLNNASQVHIRYRQGKDVGIEMKNMFDGTFSEVILVHGYMDNYPAAKEIVDFAEKTAGRPAGSFRIKAY
jgi:hypothetical protein